MASPTHSALCTREAVKQSSPDELQDECRDVKSKDAGMPAWHRTNPARKSVKLTRRQMHVLAASTRVSVAMIATVSLMLAG